MRPVFGSYVKESLKDRADRFASQLAAGQFGQDGLAGFVVACVD
jgi:hypothetical protein